jgi:hypothetical protein
MAAMIVIVDEFGDGSLKVSGQVIFFETGTLSVGSYKGKMELRCPQAHYQRQ